MVNSPWLFKVFAIMTLLFLLSACGSTAGMPAPVKEQAAQPTRAATQPTPAATPTAAAKAQAAKPAAALSCAKIVPPDELNLLLNKAPAVLNETKSGGGVTCSWQYTPRGGSQAGSFEVQVDFGDAAVPAWQSARQAELSKEAAGLAVIHIDGLGNENYSWISKTSQQQVVYVRSGNSTLVLRFRPADILFLQTESGLMDISDRIFNRMAS
jgi:hypothetical protein